MPDGNELQCPFADLRPTETALYNALNSTSVEQFRRISLSAVTIDARVRGAFVRWLVAEAIPSRKLPITRVELSNAVIDTELDLAGTELKLSFRFIDCKFEADIVLDEAKIIGFDLLRGSAGTIRAEGLTASGSLRLYGTEGFGQGPRITQLRLSGAKINGNLDLHRAALTGAFNSALLADGLTVGGNILLNDGFTAEGEVRLDGSKIQGNLDCTGATLSNKNGSSLSADAAEVTGSVYLRAGDLPFTSVGVVNFEVAKIEGDLDCSGGHFTATAFSKDEPPQAEQDVYAIIAHNLKVGADIKFKSKFVAKGVVALLNAQIGGDVRCDEGHFEFPGEVALWADGIIVSATMYLDSAETDGILRFSQAALKLGLSAEKVVFNPSQRYRGWFKDASQFDLGEKACGIYAPDAAIGGVFSWREIRKISQAGAEGNPCWLHLSGAKIDVMRDDPGSWNELDRFDITDCNYERLSDEKSSEATDWRLQQLDREYAILNGSPLQNWTLGWRAFWGALLMQAIKLLQLSNLDLAAYVAGELERHRAKQIEEAGRRFKPQPYLQLARTLSAAGHQNSAKKVLTHLERNRTRYSGYWAPRQLWQWILDATLQYGYSPFRPVLILTAWAVVCSLLFQIAFDSEHIVSIRERQFVFGVQGAPIPKSAQVRFNPVIYAIDTLVPIVDLNQKKNWIVDPLSSHSHEQPNPRASWSDSVRGILDSLPHLTGGLIVFNTFFGWLMTTLFAAGVTGLLRAKE
jgi:hypothetical protein